MKKTILSAILTAAAFIGAAAQTAPQVQTKDGTLEGPAIDLYRQIMQRYPSLHLIASGGVSSNADIEALNAAGIPAVVFGKAFYEGHINLETLQL